MKPDYQSMCHLLSDTVTVLCKNGLQYQRELKVQGVVGVTMDNNEVFYVHINEVYDGDRVRQLPSMSLQPEDKVDDRTGKETPQNVVPQITKPTLASRKSTTRKRRANTKITRGPGRWQRKTIPASSPMILKDLNEVQDVVLESSNSSVDTSGISVNYSLAGMVEDEHMPLFDPSEQFEEHHTDSTDIPDGDSSSQPSTSVHPTALVTWSTHGGLAEIKEELIESTNDVDAVESFQIKDIMLPSSSMTSEDTERVDKNMHNNNMVVCMSIYSNYIHHMTLDVILSVILLSSKSCATYSFWHLLHI